MASHSRILTSHANKFIVQRYVCAVSIESARVSGRKRGLSHSQCHFTHHVIGSRCFHQRDGDHSREVALCQNPWLKQSPEGASLPFTTETCCFRASFSPASATATQIRRLKDKQLHSEDHCLGPWYRYTLMVPLIGQELFLSLA